MTLRALLLLTTAILATAPVASATEIVDLEWAVGGAYLHAAVGDGLVVGAGAPTASQEVGVEHEPAEERPAPPREDSSQQPRRAPPPIIVVDFAEPIDLDHVYPVTSTLGGLPAKVGGAAPRAPAPAPARAPAPAAPAPLPPSAPAASELAPADIALAAMATVAAVGAAGPASIPWERVKRFLVLAGLYTRIAREHLLDHGARERLLDAIRAKPGLPLGDAARAAAIPRNTAVYHLRRLEKEGLVSSVRKGRARLYFAPGSLDQLPRADAVAALRHPVTATLATTVGAQPGMDQQALCRQLNIAPSLAHWHATRLVDAGIVRRERDGRHVRYYPGPSFDLVAVRTA